VILKLKFGIQIIDDKVKADELCNMQDGWNPRSRIVPSVALAGSTRNAFGDVYGKNHVFEYIQGKIDFEYTCEANLSSGRVNVTGDLAIWVTGLLYIPPMCL
ncbi:hypothetical protein Tco_1534952, partial [Tanacetum coccineum]